MYLINCLDERMMMKIMRHELSSITKKEAFKIFIQYLFGKFLYGILKVNSLDLKFQKLISVGTQIRA